MRDELLNMIADTHNGLMHRDPHAQAGNNSVFYFRDAIREVLAQFWACRSCGAQFPRTRTDDPNGRCSTCVVLEETQRQLERARAEIDRLQDIIDSESDLPSREPRF